MLDLEKERMRKRAPKILESLKKKKYDAHFFETAAQAAEFIKSSVKQDETIGVGGSVTLRQGLGIVEALREKGVTVYDHWEAAEDPARRLELKRMQRAVDVFLTSINAITLDGVLVNLDGGGNRVASTCSGTKRVIVVAGANKVVEDLDAAVHRTRNHASPLNAIRLRRETPCVETGTCNDCSSPQRICGMLLIMFQKPGDIDKFTVILVNEQMGY
ncbi:MAG: lactate utilization protein [Deltaproteobacteria bacterium]|nr:lactate utilization protein [Deltaproteobacteria bacterium]